ncbi:MAG: hypothetical protein IIT36_03470 [Aeriscardovia sp.]|nr:hypothetical protein [Aeriscardovia sp.]
MSFIPVGSWGSVPSGFNTLNLGNMWPGFYGYPHTTVGEEQSANLMWAGSSSVYRSSDATVSMGTDDMLSLSGCFLVDGRFVCLNSTATIHVTGPASATPLRTDSVVLRYECVNGVESVVPGVVTGTAVTGNPTAPTLNTGSMLGISNGTVDNQIASISWQGGSATVSWTVPVLPSLTSLASNITSTQNSVQSLQTSLNSLGNTVSGVESQVSSLTALGLNIQPVNYTRNAAAADTLNFNGVVFSINNKPVMAILSVYWIPSQSVTLGAWQHNTLVTLDSVFDNCVQNQQAATSATLNNVFGQWTCNYADGATTFSWQPDNNGMTLNSGVVMTGSMNVALAG